MAIKAMRDAGVLREDAEVLGVGAGNEPTLFWLTSYVKRVHATDLYLEGPVAGIEKWNEMGKWLREVRLRDLVRATRHVTPIVANKLKAGNRWSASADQSMLRSPESHWSGDWRPRRLVVQDMDALNLRYEDESFDAIFSSSSIEHFGTLDRVRRSIHEMCRVLRPGGLLTLSTEWRLAGPRPGLPGILMFDGDMLYRQIFRDLPLSAVSEFDGSVSRATLDSRRDFVEVLADMSRHVLRHGSLALEDLVWSHYPHVVLSFGDRAWTSVHLALRKNP
jgi:SAM-dependent methyltransferase